MISRPLTGYVLTAAFRDKLIITLILMILLGGSVSVFLGSASVTEQQAFAVVFGAGGLRFLGVLGIVLFVSFHMRRAFESKEVEFLLSRPISRTTYMVSHAMAFLVLAVLVGAAITVAIGVVGRPELHGLLLWGLSVMIELAIMASASLFFSMVMSSAAGSALACLGLYVLARMIGTILGIANIGTGSIVVDLLGYVMEVIAIVIPRLDLLAQTSWLVYGAAELDNSVEFMRNASAFSQNFMQSVGVLGFVLLQGIVFTALLTTASVFDLLRRQF